MPYTVNNTRGSIVSTVNDGTTASIGGITLIGKNFTGYGETIAETVKLKTCRKPKSNTARTLSMKKNSWIIW